jgi:hypothetical protein
VVCRGHTGHIGLQKLPLLPPPSPNGIGIARMLRKRGLGEKPTLTSFMLLLPDKGVSSLPLLQMVAASASLNMLGSMGSKPPGIRVSTTTSDWSSGLVTCRAEKQDTEARV